MIDPHLAQVDPEIAALVAAEERRQFEKIRLIPSENYVSRAVLEATGSVFTNKYSEGYPGKRYYEGQQYVDPVEQLAIARAKALFGADHANVQPYSGSPANLAVYFAFCKPGDTIMGMALPHGGHLTHGWNVSITGAFFRSVQYGVARRRGSSTTNEVRELARKERPKLIFAGATAYPRIIDFAALRPDRRRGRRAPSSPTWRTSPASSPAARTRRRFRTPTSSRPRRTRRCAGRAAACCSARRSMAKAIDKAVFPGLQGGPHNHTTAGIAVALKEAATPEFKAYAHQIVKNARALAEALAGAASSSSRAAPTTTSS